MASTKAPFQSLHVIITLLPSLVLAGCWVPELWELKVVVDSLDVSIFLPHCCPLDPPGLSHSILRRLPIQTLTLIMVMAVAE